VSNRSIDPRNEAAFCYVEVKTAGESRAGQYKYPDVERAARELHQMMEAWVRV
jgi:DNA-binding sugar fermentation-stimulating protein